MKSASCIVLLSCGSFNPLTPLHLRMFELARDHYHQNGSHRVSGGIISPVHDSYNTKFELISAKHRCEIINLSIQSSNWIKLSDWECTQEKWCSTKTSLEYHQNYINSFINESFETRRKLPKWLPTQLIHENCKIQMKLLCGMDFLESFIETENLWNKEDIEEILKNYGLIVISKNGVNTEKLIFDSDLLTRYKKNINLITNWVPNDVSSFYIRRLIFRGESIKYLIDDSVIDYIIKHDLYKSYNSNISTEKNKKDNKKSIRFIEDYENVSMDTTDCATYSKIQSKENVLENNIAFTDFLKNAIKENRLKIINTEFSTV